MEHEGLKTFLTSTTDVLSPYDKSSAFLFVKMHYASGNIIIMRTYKILNGLNLKLFVIILPAFCAANLFISRTLECLMQSLNLTDCDMKSLRMTYRKYLKPVIILRNLTWISHIRLVARD